jgi:protein gp37
MANETAIGWTNKSWNPVTGCSKVSEGCRNCYAEAISLRFGRSKHPWSAQYAAENVVLHPERMGIPLTWKTPSMCFVNSMSDLFHELVPYEYIASVFDMMGWSARQHTYQVLTKRPERMAAVVAKIVAEKFGGEPPANVWLGTSVEDQKAADERIPELLKAPAAVRFLSCEPLLGPLDLSLWTACDHPSSDGDGHGAWICSGCGALHHSEPTGVGGFTRTVTDRPGLAWCIVGGESGQKHRPMDLDWARQIIGQCQQAGIATFVKQDSGLYPGKQGRIPDDLWLHQFPEPTAPAPERAAEEVGHG